jgi:hypothetical protein
MSYESHKYHNGNLYASIAKDVKNQQLFTKPICMYYNGCKKIQQLFPKPICRYCNGCKKTSYYLQDLYVGIAYLKWPYENYKKKDVNIAQCSF